uniref:Putative SapC family protein n=1 Tax=Magnetococcus massalia (strain MO-1) TaxID=451514 RepID=A0A1S7LG31_MAGMO|nr:putative SapC family protein [Candidatus Magnetococcus massalia]
MSQQIYSNVAPLSSEVHKDYKLKPLNNITFAKEIQSCPVADMEFFPCAQSHPILFTSLEDGGDGMAMALMGIESQKNSYVNDDGQWEAGTYLPAFLRRYPFIMMKDDKNDRMVVALDMDFEGVNQEEGQALFAEDGEPTEFMNGAMKFMQDYFVAIQRTQNFIKRLDELELLEDANFNWEYQGKKSTFTGFKRINEQKLDSLEEDVQLELFKSGYYKLIVAHLISLRKFQDLVDRKIKAD